MSQGYASTVLGYTALGLRKYWSGVHEALRKRRWEAERERRISAYRERYAVRKLHMGAGPSRLTGWLDTDLAPCLDSIMYLDVREPFPFADSSFRYVFSEHLIEHLTYAEGQHMLKECRRVLEPDGTLRVATPNLLRLLELFEPSLPQSGQRYIDWTLSRYHLPTCSSPPCFVLNNFMRAWGHKFVYDPVTLKAAVESVGFTKTDFVAPGESDDTELRGVEFHGREIGEEYNLFETMVCEARA